MAQICLSLTGRTIAEDLAVLDLHRDHVDLAELRADYLEPSEMLHLRSFPERAGLPCILTVRRRMDGGVFDAGEGVRLVMLGKGLTHARTDTASNFAYVDLETDFRVPAIEEACRIFGTRIIRSYHGVKGGLDRLDAIWAEVAEEPYDIPKIAMACEGAGDLARLLSWSKSLPDREKILVGMGIYGFPTRVLADRMGSFLAYTSALAAGLPSAAPGHFDPASLVQLYRFRSIGKASAVYALAGGPSVTNSRSPELHNAAFASLGIDAVYLPFPTKDVPSFLAAADAAEVCGASITVPHKEAILPYLATMTDEVRAIGACNTIRREGDGWAGFNSDATGFERDLLQFLKRESLAGMRVTLIGSGGAARAVAHVLGRLGASCLVLNRTQFRARTLAKAYGFSWACNDERAQELVAEHSELIVNATSVGMTGGEEGDPLDWYDFTGSEKIYDLVYKPERTRLLLRAMEAGCPVRNGWGMLQFQAAEQFRIWTGLEPPSVYFE